MARFNHVPNVKWGVIVFLIALSPIWLHAGLNRWTALGAGGAARTVAVSPNNPDLVFVGTENSGLFRTSDNGAHWIRMDIPPDYLSVQSILFVPTFPETLFVAIGNAVFRSPDEGVHWFQSFRLEPSIDDFTSLVAGGPPASILSALTESGRLFRSFDMGHTWEEVTLPFDCANGELFTCLASEMIVYAIAWTGDLYKSSDAGDSWNAVNLGGLHHQNSKCFAVHPQDPSLLFSACWEGVYRSSDEGRNWDSVLQPSYFVKFVFNPQQPETLYVIGFDIFVSLNLGTDWEKVAKPFNEYNVNDLAIGAGNSEIIYAVTENVVYRSGTNRTDWSFFGLPSLRSPRYVTVGAGDSEVLYVVDRAENLAVSSNGGNSWMSSVLPDNNSVAIARVDPIDPLKVSCFDVFGQFWSSSDNGRNWSPLGKIDSQFALYSYPQWLFFSPVDPHVVYACSEHLLYISRDEGLSWTTILTCPNDSLSVFAPDPARPETMYLGISSYILKTENGGNSWVINESAFLDDPVLSLVVHPSYPDILYAGTITSIYRSEDGGESWIRAAELSSNQLYPYLAVDSGNPSQSVLASWISAFRSLDDGRTWAVANAGLPYNQVEKVEPAPDRAHRFYALGSLVYVIDFGTGDLNGDGRVDPADSALLRAYLAETSSGLPAGPDSADLTVDGRVNVVDLVRLSSTATPDH